MTASAYLKSLAPHPLSADDLKATNELLSFRGNFGETVWQRLYSALIQYYNLKSQYEFADRTRTQLVAGFNQVPKATHRSLVKEHAELRKRRI